MVAILSYAKPRSNRAHASCVFLREERKAQNPLEANRPDMNTAINCIHGSTMCPPRLLRFLPRASYLPIRHGSFPYTGNSHVRNCAFPNTADIDANPGHGIHVTDSGPRTPPHRISGSCPEIVCLSWEQAGDRLCFRGCNRRIIGG